jgi:hypothetical protein
LEGVLGRVTDTSGDKFAMSIDGREHTKRVEAGDHLHRFMNELLRTAPPEGTGSVVEVGRIAGLRMTGQVDTTFEDQVRIAIPDACIEVTWSLSDWNLSEPSNLITRVERQVHRLPESLASAQAEASECRR